MAASSAVDLPPNTSQAPLMLWLIWAMTAVAAVIIALRLFTSVTVLRKISLSDYLVVAALIFGIACNALFTVSAHFGLGRHIFYLTTKQLVATFKFLVIAQPFGMVSPMFGRMSLATYLLQLVGPWKLNRYILYLVIGLEMLVNLVSVILYTSQCGTHPTELWNIQGPAAGHYCLARSYATNFDYFQGSFNTLVDLVLTFIPMKLVISLKLRPRIKAGLMVLLGLSLLASVASILRTYQLSVLIKSVDFTRTSVPFAIWYNIENFVVIVAASIPTIRPLFTQHKNQQPGSSATPLSYSTSGDRSHGHDKSAEMGFGGIGAGNNRPMIMRSDTWDVSRELTPEADNT
ncbi:hypothetical protein PV11_00040 [Exophiala sideris]|uniref:Rhodopsin domain-containing protein n=1 Tax=Exophiala sideris TaxID=1016849 RepID=A0A0D1W6E2_9EURO|nr:hypothetical protein PV11_00040 [Exophiala sideris]